MPTGFRTGILPRSRIVGADLKRRRQAPKWGRGRLNKATFTGDAWFGEATFTGTAEFNQATFTGDAWFSEALAHRLSFSRALFSAPDPGPWIASTISLDRTTLAVRSRIAITATKIDASWFQAREGAHLVRHCTRVDLSDSEFGRRSIVSSPAAAEQIPPRPEPPRPEIMTSQDIAAQMRRGLQRQQQPRSSETISHRSWAGYRLDVA